MEILQSSFMYVLHDLFKQQIQMALTSQMMLFPGNRGSGSLSDLPKNILGKQGFKSSLLWFQSPCSSPL